jgi:hypothetical protein
VTQSLPPFNADGIRWVRAWLAIALFLIVIAVAGSLWRHPSAARMSPAAAVVVLALLTVLMAGYAWAAAREPSPAARAGARVGLVVALLWLVEVLTGNAFGDHAWTKVVYFGAIAGVAAATLLVGYAAAPDGVGGWTDGAVAGTWSGLVSAPVPMLTLLFLVNFTPHIVVSDPQNIAEATHAGTPDVLGFALGDDILAGTNHLWLGVLLGALLGSIGGLAHQAGTAD